VRYSMQPSSKLYGRVRAALGYVAKPLRMVRSGPTRTNPALHHASKGFRNSCSAHVDVDDDCGDRDHGCSWVNENGCQSQRSWHHLRPPQNQAAQKQNNGTAGLHPEQHLLARVEAACFWQSRFVVHCVAMSLT